MKLIQRAKLIYLALIHYCVWIEELIHRDETAWGVDIIEGMPRRRECLRIDYALQIRINIDTQPFAIALIEAKQINESPAIGLEQAKKK